jgi:flagellar hook protein FlgE
MVRAFNIGISGLNAHQTKLDVVSNNIANMNTVGYKGRDVHFADLFYETIRPATDPNSTNLGGTNPSQIGSGVRVASIDTNISQGVLQSTQSPLDVAMSGGGYFVVSDGSQNFYTRAGNFGLDTQNRLVDKATGLHVTRFGTLGEPDGTNFSFQTPGDMTITVPMGATVPGRATSQLNLAGNLDALSTLEQPEILGSQSPLIDSTTSAPATLATLLNDLASNQTGYAAGDQIVISGQDFDGSPISAPMAVDGTTTLGDVVNFINATFTQSTASLDASGNIVLTSSQPGETAMQLVINDSSGGTQVGTSDWSAHAMNVQQPGQDNAVVTTSARVFDVRGVAHNLTLQFERTGNNTWDMTANLDPSSGVMIDDRVEQITFNDAGTGVQALGTGTGDVNLSFQINGVSAPQSFTVSLGQPDELTGLTQIGSASDISFSQDGYEPGEISDVEVDSDGVINAVASNGQQFQVAQLAIAAFRNPAGLHAEGNNYLTESANSGAAEIGPGATGSRGTVNSYHLEDSNVDLAREFTQLIIAQRGFAANTRTITAADEILQELINIIR